MIAIVTFRSVKMCQYLQNVQQIHQLNSSLIQVSSIFISAVKHNELDKTDEVHTKEQILNHAFRNLYINHTSYTFIHTVAYI